MAEHHRIATCIWMERDGLEAARFYTSLLPDSAIIDAQKFDHMATGEPDGVQLIEFTLAGAPYIILQAGPHQSHTDMMSILVNTDDQAETDRLWEALTAKGGKGVQCGWLIDRWGIRWQIAPRRIAEMVDKGRPEQVSAMMRAMHPMVKIDLATLEAAFAGA